MQRRFALNQEVGECMHCPRCTFPGQVRVGVFRYVVNILEGANQDLERQQPAPFDKGRYLPNYTYVPFFFVFI